MAENAQYVTLGLAEEVFAAPVERVQEILEVQPVSRMPNAPAWFLGMIDVRGRGVPVLDLRLRLDLEAIPDSVNTRIVVLKLVLGGRELIVGLKTDRVFEVTVLDASELEQPPEIGARWNSGLVAGIGRRNGKFVTVLDLNLLLGDVDARLIADRPSEATAA